MPEKFLRSLLSEGQRVSLFLAEEEKPYLVTVESLDEEDIEITAPLMKGYCLPVEKGSDVEIRVGTRSGLFRLPFRITDREGGNVSTLRLSLNGTINKIQRRELMRMDIFVDFDLEFPYGGVFKPPQDFQLLRGKRGNLSGGGLLFYANKPLPVDFKLNARLNLEPHFNRAVIAQARVVRVDSDPFKNNIYGIALEFESIREGDRDKIISYILHKERDIIRRTFED